MTKRRRFAIVARLAAILLWTGAVFHCRSSIRGNLIALLDLPYSSQPVASLSSPVEARLVAHAGGAVKGLTYTNSLEALDEHYAQGYRVFELDFHWTSDNRLVVIHDWGEASHAFNTKRHVFNYTEYVHARRRDGLHQLTFEDVRRWLDSHLDAFVVTDTKDSNSRFLRYLQTSDGDIGPQLIIQIYRMSELKAARQLGPRAVWLTVYKDSIPAWALSRISGVDAFIIPVELYGRYRNPHITNRVHCYVHSVPAQAVEVTFRQLPDIYGIYVD